MRTALLLCLTLLQPQESAVRFLPAKEAADAIVDESMEPYFSLLQPLEMTAKTGLPIAGSDLAAKRDDCRKQYRAAVRDFTDDEMAAIAVAAQAITKWLKEAYPLLAAIPWSFIKVDTSLEGGMPHTRGPHVVIPERMARQFAALNAQGGDPARSRLAQTLIHELCHVAQRARPDLFADLYVNVWGLVRAKGLPGHPWLDQVQIVNPDGPDVGWVFPVKDGFWQPLVVLEGTRMPRDFRFVGVAREKQGDTFALRLKDGHPETMLLKDIPAYAEAFKAFANFHPNETFAEQFAEMAMRDMVQDPRPAVVNDVKLRDWCRKNFAKK